MKNNSEQQIWVIVPAYNEEFSIGNVIRDVLTIYKNVLVVDDCSIDQTAYLATQAGANVLRHSLNLGQGAALQTGITYALRRGASLIVTFDADGQHSVGDVEVLISALNRSGVEIALGSRFLGSTVGISWGRKILLKVAILFTNITTGLVLTDAHNGLRVFTKNAAEKICLTQNRMAHASEIVETIVRLKIPYIEAPVTISYTEYSRLKGQRALGGFFILLDLIIKKEQR
jgi:glycosyltransferase involved in cell wall biosynthesis